MSTKSRFLQSAVALGLLGAVALFASIGADRTGTMNAGAAAPLPPPHPVKIEPVTVGMNLGAGQYWTPEWVFADMVRNNGLMARYRLGNLDGLKVDPEGHPFDVPKNTELEILLELGSHWRTGLIECTMSPGWVVTSLFTGKIVSGNDEKFRINIPKAIPGELVKLHLTAKSDGAKLDHASCLPVGMPADTLFRPDFLNDYKPFRVIRFMDWMRTNNEAYQTWAMRPKPGDFTQLTSGMAVEYMVAMANQLGADPWFTLPFDADPDYYRNFAIYVRDHLAPGRKAYVELSNEVWNGSFKQARDAMERGKKIYPHVEDYQAGDFYYADRVKDLMKIWSDVFAGQTGRIVRVVGGQMGWKERTDALLAHNDLWRSADAYAVAPYFGNAIQDISETGKPRIDKALNRLPPIVDDLIRQAVGQKAVVDKYGLRYVTYEGGPDVLGYSPDAQADANAIIADPRLYTIYSDFLEKWRTKIGGLLVLYNGIDASTYAHKLYTGQPPEEAPKMHAVLDFIARTSGTNKPS